MTADIIPMPEPLDKVGARLDAAYNRTQRGRNEWIEGSLELATILVEARARFPSDHAFGAWLGENDHDHLGKNDRAALINFGADLKAARICFQETTRFSYQLLWEDVKSWFPSARKPASESKSIPEPPPAPVVEPKTVEPPRSEQPPPARVHYDVPQESKIYDLYGPELGRLLCRNFQHARKPKLFMRLLDNAGPSVQKQIITKLRYLAERCVMSDYPTELKENTEAWTNQLLYPHLPRALIDKFKQTPNGIHQYHTALIETERQFVLAPEFGVTDPPMVAFNKAWNIYNVIVHKKNGGTVDPAAHHKPTYANDEGKPPVIIRGTQLWPAEVGEDYCYDDLRCAYGFANDVLLTFKETREPPMSTQSLKLRHLMSWIENGYNSKGSTTAGMLKALRSVVQAYSSNKSEEMQTPLSSMVKNDE